MATRRKFVKRSRVTKRVGGVSGWRALNVHADSLKIRRIRRAAFLRQSLKLTICIVAGIMAFVMVKHAFHRMLFQNDHFALKQVEFSTDGKLSRAVVLDKTGLSGKENLLELDLAKVEESIRALPTVAEVRVKKCLPNALSIDITERQPVAWLSCPALGIRPRSSTSGQLIDAKGVAIACDRLRVEYMSFPVIEVSGLGAVVTGRKVESDSLDAALMCLAAGSEILMPIRTTISEIHASNDYSLLVVLNSGEEAIISNENVEVDLQRFANAYVELAHTMTDDRAWRVNLLARRNVPLVFLDHDRDLRPAAAVERQEDSRPTIRKARPVDPTTLQPIEPAAPVERNSTRFVDDDLTAILNRG